MAFHRIRHKSIISSSESETSFIDSSSRNSSSDKPLINSAIGTNTMNDEEIARQQQHRIYDANYMDVDETPKATATANTFDRKRLEEIDADAALAQKLQDEEYSKPSIMPYQYRSNDETFLPYIIDPDDDERTISDAQIAAQLQEEEDGKNRTHRPRPTNPTQRRISQSTTNRTNTPEVIPVPSTIRPTRQRPPSGRNNTNPTVNNMASLFQLLASAGQQISSNHETQNIQNTDRDFGPEDYDNLIELDNSIAGKPLTDDQINRLPTDKFRGTVNKNDEENKCNICWDQFETNQLLRRLPCLHKYHKDCIDPWLKKSNICPICRHATN